MCNTLKQVALNRGFPEEEFVNFALKNGEKYNLGDFDMVGTWHVDALINDFKKSRMAGELLIIAKELLASDNSQTFKKDEEGYAEISFKVKGDALESFLKLLKQCEYNGQIGHSFEIEIDQHGGEDRKRSVGFDGDGEDRVTEIKVNGKPLSKTFEW